MGAGYLLLGLRQGQRRAPQFCDALIPSAQGGVQRRFGRIQFCFCLFDQLTHERNRDRIDETECIPAA